MKRCRVDFHVHLSDVLGWLQVGHFQLILTGGFTFCRPFDLGVCEGTFHGGNRHDGIRFVQHSSEGVGGLVPVAEYFPVRTFVL